MVPSPIMRRALVLLSFALACRSRPDATTVETLPTATVAAPNTGTLVPSARPSGVTRVCEPTIACGMWSACEWLELDHVEDAGYEVFRVAGSDAGGYGSHFWRWHHCWPADAGLDHCAMYCVGGSCVDGMEADGVCTASAPPRPSPYVCEVRGADCVTRRDP